MKDELHEGVSRHLQIAEDLLLVHCDDRPCWAKRVSPYSRLDSSIRPYLASEMRACVAASRIRPRECHRQAEPTARLV